jgi:hypothetical protein
MQILYGYKHQCVATGLNLNQTNYTENNFFPLQFPPKRKGKLEEGNDNNMATKAWFALN